jgi:hypothetical protein
VPSRGRRWHRSGLSDSSSNGNGVALALCGALGLWLALEGAVPSRGRRWHRSGLSDGGGNDKGVALSMHTHARIHTPHTQLMLLAPLVQLAA